MSTSNSTKLRIRACTEDDLEALVRVGDEAFRGDPISLAVFPERLRVKPGTQDECEFRLKTHGARIHAPESHYIVAVEDVPVADGTGETGEEIVGFAIWTCPLPPDQDKSEEEREKERKALDEPPPPYVDQEARKKIKDAMQNFEKSVMGEKGASDYWCLMSIGVDPKHRRKGVGKQVVQWGIDEAAKDDRDVWLIATPAGKKLYVSMGFDILGEMTLLGDVQTQMVKKRSASGPPFCRAMAP